MTEASPATSKGLGRFFSLIVILGLLMLAVVLISAKDRSFLLEAETSGVRLTFHGEANAWNFEEATLCTPRPVPQPRLAAQDDGSGVVCSPVLFETRNLTDHAINWRASSTVDVTIDAAGALSIRLVDNRQPDLPDGAFIVVPANAWARHGALTFSSALRIGDTIASGSRNYLHSGRWEVRQGGLATSLFRDAVEVVKRGDFTLGASVEVYSGSEPATLYGSLTSSGEAGIHLVALSQRGPVELKLGYFGLHEPTVLRPDWIDRVTSSSTLIALVALMTFVATGYQIVLFSRMAEIMTARRNASPTTTNVDEAGARQAEPAATDPADDQQSSAGV